MCTQFGLTILGVFLVTDKRKNGLLVEKLADRFSILALLKTQVCDLNLFLAWKYQKLDT